MYGLRHAFATSLLSEKFHPTVIQQALGHSSINLTIDTYSYVIPDIEETAAQKIDETIGKKSEEFHDQSVTLSRNENRNFPYIYQNLCLEPWCP